jgi:hypothetical protein
MKEIRISFRSEEELIQLMKALEVVCYIAGDCATSPQEHTQIARLDAFTGMLRSTLAQGNPSEGKKT